MLQHKLCNIYQYTNSEESVARIQIGSLFFIQALILQETENHIVNIENKFRDLLEQKAKAKGKSLVMQTEFGFVEAKLGDIRREFSNKQENLYLQNCSQRKKSNIPSDLELGLIDLRSSMCNLSVVPHDCLQEFLSSSNSTEICKTLNKEEKQQNLSSDLAEVSADTVRGKMESLKVQQDLNDTPECQTLPPRTPVKSRRGRPSRRQMCQYRFDRVVSPEHSNISENYSSFTSENFHQGHLDVPECNFYSRDRTPSRTRKRGHDSSSRTPARSTKQRLFETHSGFTPVKLPDVVPVTPGSPRSKPQHQSPFTVLSSDNHQQDSPPRDEICMVPDLLFSPLDTASLLCTESMDLMDLDDGHQPNENTPHHDKGKKTKEIIRDRGTNKSHGQTRRSRSLQNQHHPSEENHRQARRCRRQLEKSFPASEKTLTTETPVITGVFENTDINCCQDFDGYFQFYQQMAAESPETPETASRVAQMWRSMSPNSRETFVAMAALDSQSVTSIISDFSDDLRDLDLEPIIDCFQPSAKESNGSQCVPEYTSDSPEHVHHSPPHSSVQMVPESTVKNMTSYLKMGPASVSPDLTGQHAYQDMFDSAAFNTGSIYQAAYMISANQFLDQSDISGEMCDRPYCPLTSPPDEATDSQAVPDMDLVLGHLIEDFKIPTL
ncbi:uncharacterized protein LOC117335888 [Pecten maximus]|uniref:uncharacterized protein LOC117335888 n=1 Tax=Pecten maximus TaxID=6579 RepID=UPI001458E5CD|nr:uncharacterized protein LOC117335888 [Pecten maximus]